MHLCEFMVLSHGPVGKLLLTAGLGDANSMQIVVSPARLLKFREE